MLDTQEVKKIRFTQVVYNDRIRKRKKTTPKSTIKGVKNNAK